MKLFNLFKKSNNSNDITPTLDTNNTIDNTILDKVQYYESKIRIYCQLVIIEKNNRVKQTLEECFNKLISTCSDNKYYINSKEELLSILNTFYDRNKDLIESKEFIMDYITNEFKFKILTPNELKEIKLTNNKLKKLRNIIYNNYEAINKNNINKDFAWMVFCLKNKLNKNELLNNLHLALQENNIDEEIINKELDNLNIILSFGNIPTEEEVNAYRKTIGNTKDETIDEALNFFMEKINNNDNPIYINLYSTFYWSRYSNKSKKSKEEILSSLKNSKKFELIKKSINNFENICSDETLLKAQQDLERYVVILDLKKYINNWKQIKTNQISESNIEDKNRYFKELEEDYLNLTNSLKDTLNTINNCINIINSRDYIKNLNINSTKIMQEINMKTDNINSIENELSSIKRWQETISNLRKY